MSVVDPDTVKSDDGDSKWKEIKVTAHMEKPVVTFGNPITLGGPLQWAAYQMHDDKASLPDPDHEWCVDFELPIAKWEYAGSNQPFDQLDDRALSADGNLWGWCISVGQADWQINGKTHVRKKEPSNHVKDWSTKKVVNTVSGQYKSANKPYPIKYADTIEWYMLGDPEKLRPYLRRITHLGKLHSKGWGKIRCNIQGYPRWTIQQTDTAWLSSGTNIIANIPEGFYGESGSPSMQSMRPPMWDHRRHALMIGGQNVKS